MAYFEFIQAVHVRKNFLNILKSQSVKTTSVKEILHVDSYCAYDVFHAQYKFREILCK